MIKIDIKISIDQTVEVGECHRGRTQYGQNYRGREYDQKGDNFRRGNFRGIQNYRGKNLEVDIKVTLETPTLEEIGVGLEKDSMQVTSGEMREAVVDQDQVQDQVPIEIGLDALNVGSTIILPNIVQIYQI